MIRAMRVARALMVAGLIGGVLVTGAVAHGPASPPAGRSPAPAVAPSADEVLAEVRRATERYRDVAQARAEGYVASGMEPGHGHHFVNVQIQLLAAASGTLDLARPPVLVYIERDGVWQLVGVEYVLPSRPATDPFPGAEWHRHEASCHYRDDRELAAPRAADCPPRHPATGAAFVLWHPTFAVVHVWAWHPNPLGPFAPENPALAAWTGTAPVGSGHRHARSESERLYSELSHRAAGGILLVLAAVTAWESRRPRRLPWSALSAGLWVLFGLYLIPTTDPESWPWGPKRFAEIFTDPIVLQHKALALLTIMIGVTAGLRAFGILPPARWAALAAGLATIGGVSLFLHFHEDRIHIDAVYLQHALMGLAALGLGGTLLLARRSPRGEAVLRWAWPVFLAMFGVVLLVYREL
jgi:hypothetical protein